MASLDTATPGEFSATYTLMFSDENLPGALTKSLTLMLMGEVTPAMLAGDFNGDDIVDASDYTVWRDGSGTIYTLDDYDDWKSNFGRSAGSGVGSLAGSLARVPEPAAWILVLGAIAVFRSRELR